MSRTYSVKEIFPTLQGEGRWAGRPAVFLRFAGCNLWDGNPEHRHQGKGACARWCDTSFAKGDKMGADDIVAKLESAWRGLPSGRSRDSARMVVITGGEPALQYDRELERALKAAPWYVAMETNGTTHIQGRPDWVCVSPKRGSELKVWQADELKVVIPGCVPGAPASHQWSVDDLRELAEKGRWGNLWLQPQDVTNEAAVEETYLHAIRRGATSKDIPVTGAIYEGHVHMCIDLIQQMPGWRLCIQQHKIIGLR